MLHSSIQVYLINLDRSPDRLANAKKNLDMVGMPFERISAIDGSQLDMNNIENFAVPDAIAKHKWITPSVIGCSLSHYDAYKKILASNAEWGVVIEDDVEFSSEIVDTLNDSIKVINKADVFLLYFHGEEKQYSRSVIYKVNAKYTFHAAIDLWDGGYSAGAYLIHRNVAKKLHDYVFPVHISSDCWGDFQKDGVIGGLWALLPPISDSAYFGSDITYSNVGRFFRLIEKMKILPLSGFIRWLRVTLKTTVIKYSLVDFVPEWYSSKQSSSDYID